MNCEKCLINNDCYLTGNVEAGKQCPKNAYKYAGRGCPLFFVDDHLLDLCKFCANKDKCHTETIDKIVTFKPKKCKNCKH